MSVKSFNLPDPGEGLTEAEIVTWRVAPGDVVTVNDIIVEVETAKSLVELPVPFAGRVTQLHVSEGDTVEVGTPIISVETDASRAGSAPVAAPPTAAQAPEREAPKEAVSGDEPEIEEGKIGGTTSTGRTAVLVGYGVKQTEAKRRPRKPAGLPVRDPDEFVPAPEVAVTEPQSRTPRTAPPTPLTPAGRRPLAKPPVRKLAKDLGVDLAALTPNDPSGVISRAEVQAAAAGNDDAAASQAAAGIPADEDRTGWRVFAPSSGDSFPANVSGETRYPVKGVRKLTAQAMVQSAFTAPHVTEWVTVDVTRTVELVERLKHDKEFADVKVTPLLVLAKAICLALARNPGINATWDEVAQEIVVKHYVNLGIAAATPRGLIVPNIKDAQHRTLHQLATALGELTATAREGRTPPADMTGGTITITNVGVFGVAAGTPIINPGESAIVCFGAIRKQPWVVTNAQGEDELAIRHVTTLAVSFDHRLIDGELGSRFTADVAAILEDPSRALVWG